MLFSSAVLAVKKLIKPNYVMHKAVNNFNKNKYYVQVSS